MDVDTFTYLLSFSAAGQGACDLADVLRDVWIQVTLLPEEALTRDAVFEWLGDLRASEDG